MKRSRTDILIAVLAAFSGIRGNLTEREWAYGIAIVEDEYGCDLEAVERDLRAEMAACSLACRIAEKD